MQFVFDGDNVIDAWLNPVSQTGRPGQSGVIDLGNSVGIGSITLNPADGTSLSEAEFLDQVFETHDAAAVPEPSTISTSLLALTVIAVPMRRRRTGVRQSLRTLLAVNSISLSPKCRNAKCSYSGSLNAMNSPE